MLAGYAGEHVVVPDATAPLATKAIVTAQRHSWLDWVERRNVGTVAAAAGGANANV